MSLRITGSRGLDKLKALIARGDNTRAALASVYPVYQELQIERFKTENASEGGRWDSLEPSYQKQKLRRFRSYPGSGNKIMVGTGMLAGAAIGPTDANPYPVGIDKHRAIFTNKSMTVYVAQSGKNPEGRPFTYASFANEKRTFTKFSRRSTDRMREAIRSYVMGDNR